MECVPGIEKRLYLRWNNTNRKEVEIEVKYDTRLLTNKNYKIDVDKNKKKAIAAIIIKDNIEYMRRNDLETKDFEITIIFIKIPQKYW